MSHRLAHAPGGRPRAFTLLEVMIAVLIVLLMIGIATPPALSLIERQRFAAAVESINGAALETRRLAIESSEPHELVYRGPVSRNPELADTPATLRDAGIERFDGGTLFVRPFDPDPESSAARLAGGGMEGVPSAFDIASDDNDREEIVRDFDQTVTVEFGDADTEPTDARAARGVPDPASLDPRAARDAAEIGPTSAADGPRSAWWRSLGAYQDGERPLLIVGPEGAPLWSGEIRIGVGARRASLAFHPLTGETRRSNETPSDANAATEPPRADPPATDNATPVDRRPESAP